MSDHKEVTYKQSTEGGKPCKPAVVFVHSSWHTPKHFEPTCQLFNANGFATECPLLPSCSGNLTLSKPLLDDAKIIYDAVSKLVVQGLEVIVVMHGYGGLVGSEAITKDLSKKERQAKNLQGGIIHLLYISAHVGPVGHTVAGGISGGGLPNRISRHENGSCTIRMREMYLYKDLSNRPQVDKALFTPMMHDAARYYPITYLYCENDQHLPLHRQQHMVMMHGSVFRTATFFSGHSLYLSQPEVVLKKAQEIVDAGV